MIPPRIQLDVALDRLEVAVSRGRSTRHCLRMWSAFIRTRDAERCVLCEATAGLSAHHIVRRSFMPMMQYETGNGITLCKKCHRMPHEAFNGRPDFQLPMDAQGGEDIDLITSLFHALSVDATRRNVLDDLYYFLSDSALRTFKNFQCIDPRQEFPGFRVEQAYLIWRQTSRAVLRLLLEANGAILPPNLTQQGPFTIIPMDRAR